MVFGSGNKIFRIRRSNSKASYLSYRRDRERGQPDADYGSYKRIISPGSGNGLSLECAPLDCSRMSDRATDEKWASTNNIHQSKESLVITHNNNNNLLHRLSLGPDIKKQSDKHKLNDLNKNDILSSRPCNLPDVLPVSAKMSPPRSLRIDRSPSECPTPSPERSPRLQYHNISPISKTPPKEIEKRILITPPKLTTPPPKTPITSPPHSPDPKKLEPVIDKRASLTLMPNLEKPFNNNRLSLSLNESSQQTLSTNTSNVTEVATSTRDLGVVKSPSPQVVEGLQLIQRTEVVLRINTCTTDAASQTDRDSESPTSVVRTPLPARRKLKEEIECDQLSRDLASQLSPSDKLKGILAPAPEYKKSTDYVSGLFKLEVTSRSRSSNAGSFYHFGTSLSNSSTSTSISTSTEDSGLPNRSTSLSFNEPSSPLSATSTYFTTSEPKAKFLTRYSRDMTNFNGVQDTKDLNQKKEELMTRLDRKLEVLRSEHLVVNEESRVNDLLGEQVSNHVSRLARPQEVTKYRLHVEEVGKITSLLLVLSGRLARAENALMGLQNDHPEKKILESKRDKLEEQLEEAKKLKENIDKRSVNVSNILYKYLNPEEYSDYDHFINMKAKLIMDAREIADKIKLGEEQLVALRETLSITNSDNP